MRSIRTILLATAVAVLFSAASCEKDENGNRITYYKKKTGEGYVFYKFKNDSVAPIANAKTQIESYTVGMFSTITNHFDYVCTDSNGKYSFKFVKTINNSRVDGCGIISSSPIGYFPSSGSIHLKSSSLDKSNKIFIDTFYIYIDRR